jgi:hypothetical protein
MTQVTASQEEHVSLIGKCCSDVWEQLVVRASGNSHLVASRPYPKTLSRLMKKSVLSSLRCFSNHASDLAHPLIPKLGGLGLDDDVNA